MQTYLRSQGEVAAAPNISPPTAMFLCQWVNKMKNDIFSNDAKYRAKRDFKSASFDYKKGEVLIFDRGAYSAYDDCFIYEFHNLSGESKIWILQMDLPVDEWKKFFDIV
jgi:hypothetical protein